MLSAGKRYGFGMVVYDRDEKYISETICHYELIAFDFPIATVKNEDGKIKMINITSPLVSSVEEC